jgi:DNA-binding CsgD family transcriptional regulator
MKNTAIEAKHQRMLELLAQGATSRIMARQMGYQEGTMRVYLHNLYRRIGVANKTEAVVWYMNRERSREDVKTAVRITPQPGSGDLVGDMALEEDLMAALGVMSNFIGPYGRVWEVGQRIAGVEIDAKTLERRGRARLLWRALLKGDWGLGKRVHDSDGAASLLLDSPAEAVLLVFLLLAGGYSLAAERLTAQLTDRRKAGRGASPREVALIGALRETLHARDDGALATLHKIAAERSAAAALQKQAAMVLLFHVYKGRADAPRARQTANAIWTEAEAARRQLQAMGERALGASASLPSPAKSALREKAVVSR